MGADAGPSWGARLLRLLLILAALDSLGAGAWAVLRPADLFAWLQLPPTRDGLLLTRALGALTLAHVPCLTLAALRPRNWAGLVAVPLLGRALLCGVWLWLLNADRVHPSAAALHGLLIHDAAWLPVLVAFLVVTARSSKHA
jgi:hypothetical protein